MALGKRDVLRALQKALGQGDNINAGNPLEVHDPKVGSLISYEGTTTADGAGDGSTLIDSVLATKPDYNGNLVIITSGAYAGQGRDINAATTGGTVTPASAFGGQILTGTNFVIVALRLVPASVALIEAKLDVQKGATGVFYEQADAAINASVVAAEQFIVTLTTANTRYILRDLRLKSVDPTAANTITVKLYTLIKDVETNVRSFIITNANFGTYFTLMDMFGAPHVAGDSIRVSLTGSAAGPYVVEGQYSHAKTNV